MFSGIEILIQIHSPRCCISGQPISSRAVPFLSHRCSESWVFEPAPLFFPLLSLANKDLNHQCTIAWLFHAQSFCGRNHNVELNINYTTVVLHAVLPHGTSKA